MTLIDRLSKLDGPDREVDREIHFATGRQLMIPPYASSVDAAIALSERVLPGMQVNVTSFHAGHAEASIGNRNFAKPSSGNNPSIALCIAILRAKEASDAQTS